MFNHQVIATFRKLLNFDYTFTARSRVEKSVFVRWLEKNVKLQEMRDRIKAKVLAKTFKTNNFLAKGASCAVYNLDEHHVLKVCKIKVPSRRRAALSRAGAKDFQDLTNHILPHVLAQTINTWTIRNSKMLVYSQRKHIPLQKHQINQSVVLDILFTVLSLLKRGVIVTDIRTKNFGIPVNSNLSHYKLFDYHSLAVWRNAEKRNRITRHFLNYFCILYYGEGYKKKLNVHNKNIYPSHWQNFPPPIVNLFNTIQTQKRRDIIVHLERVISFLNQENIEIS